MIPEEENKEQNNTTTENSGEEMAESPEKKAEQPEAHIENAPDNDTEGFEKLKAELTEAKEKYLRLYSEFDNYKKRVNKERVDLIKSAGADIIIALLPVLDDFDRALKSIESSADVEALKEGINLIAGKLRASLQQKGLKEMETIGQVFDTDLHDALTNAPAPSEEMKGKVIDEVQKGYFLNDKVIRHAKVIIGQ
jgi:molecular chaperone GrpE